VYYSKYPSLSYADDILDLGGGNVVTCSLPLSPSLLSPLPIHLPPSFIHLSIMSAPLTKVDSAIAGLSIDDKAPDSTQKEVPKEKKGHRRTSSTQENVWNIKDLGKSSLADPLVLRLIPSSEEQKIELTLPIETQKTGWYVDLYSSLFPKPLTFPRKLNTSPSTVEDKDILKLYLVNPPVKKIDLDFPSGLHVTARNLKGVTIKDALDAIYKQFKKKVSPTSHSVPL